MIVFVCGGVEVGIGFWEEVCGGDVGIGVGVGWVEVIEVGSFVVFGSAFLFDREMKGVSRER